MSHGIEVDPFIASIEEQRPYIVERTQRLSQRLGDVERWKSYLFGKNPQMQHYERMIESLHREFLILASLGLFRPAIYALRSFFELHVAWVYYAEHPREWHSCQINGSFFLTPGNLMREVSKYFVHLRFNLEAIFGMKLRDITSPYSELSSHVHSQDPVLMPYIESAQNLVRGQHEFAKIEELARRVNAYLFNWYAACLVPEHWTSISPELRQRITEQVPAAKLGRFNSGSVD